MNINFNKISNIKTLKDLNMYSIKKPLIKNNYIFHYLTIVNNLDGLKLKKFPIYIENIDKLNCFHLAAKESNINILHYLIENYSDYIYNRNSKNETFMNYLDYSLIISLLKKYPNLDWTDLILNQSKNILLKNILINMNYNDIIVFIDILKLKLFINKYQYLFFIIKNNNLNTNQKIKILNNYSDNELNIKSEDGNGLLLIIINNNNSLLFNYIIKRNIDINYFTLINSYNPLRQGLYMDIINNINFYF